MRILKAANHRSMPWKNGGGITTEIAVSPAGTGLDDFDWRISMARVEAGGPFSQFSGIDRTLAILEGAGIVLAVGDRDPVRIDRSSLPHHFPADMPTNAALVSGAVTDLNVMTRRSRFRHSVERAVLSAPAEIEADGAAIVVFCLSGNVSVAGDSAALLGPLDALVVEDGTPMLVIEPETISTIFIARINAVMQND